jgi:hypothetical protein
MFAKAHSNHNVSVLILFPSSVEEDRWNFLAHQETRKFHLSSSTEDGNRINTPNIMFAKAHSNHNVLGIDSISIFS